MAKTKMKLLKIAFAFISTGALAVAAINLYKAVSKSTVIDDTVADDDTVLDSEVDILTAELVKIDIDNNTHR
ncbi:hypothetical protein, partial [Klebsiella pneumoniae]|uniref:hypothetical protein n=1 Tax=Klebsiella pneumoniae TaxID=573 RepID=UPI00396A7A03